MTYIGLQRTYTATVDEDPVTGDLYIPLPKELLQELGWSPDDTIHWIEEPNGTWRLTKVEE